MAAQQGKRPVVVFKRIGHLIIMQRSVGIGSKIKDLLLSLLEYTGNVASLDVAEHLCIGFVAEHYALGVGKRSRGVGFYHQLTFLFEVRFACSFHLFFQQVEFTFHFHRNLGNEHLERNLVGLVDGCSAPFAPDVPGAVGFDLINRLGAGS